MRFLTTGNIPKSNVKLCAITDKFPEINNSLMSRGISLQIIKPHKKLPEPIAFHADMLLHDLGEGRLVVAKGCNELILQLKEYGFIVEEQSVSREYPGDIALNCFALGKYLFCKIHSTSKLLLNYYQSKGIEPVDVKQGYTKCSTCIVNEKAIITADKSISEAAQNHGVDILEIKAGHIILPGYDTGFIGGCCGLIDRHTLAFTGRISAHPDYKRIKAFCLMRGVELLELTDMPLIDVGGIIPLLV